MNWLINNTFKSYRDKYDVYLTVDKALNPFTFTYPALWTGFVSGDINNITPLEKGDIELRQTSRVTFEKIKYPSFASGVYDQIIQAIQDKQRSMD